MKLFPLVRFAGSASMVFGRYVYEDEGKPFRPFFNFLGHIDRRIWKLRYRYDRKHQYHLVNTGLEPDYYDIDSIMLHANMALLCRYVEDERGGEDELQKRVDYLHSEEAVKDYGEDMSPWGEPDIEALRIYRWWKTERPANEELYNKMMAARYSGKLEFKPIEGSEYREVIVPAAPEGAPSSEEIWDFEKKLKQDETDNLISLIKMRGSLWT